VTLRGTCPRVLRAQLGQAAGAAAVAMINTDSGFPAFEGPIQGVSIPFFGVRGVLGTAATDDPDSLVTADSPQGTGGTVTLTNASIANPGFAAVAGFSSGGPRNGDSFLKPDVTAPGVSVFSTAVGTGSGGDFMSGTSMAAPHVAGVAALVKQAHPDWRARELKAAIVSTANPAAIVGYQARTAGAGLVQPLAGVKTAAFASTDRGNVALNFGFEELRNDLTEKGRLTVTNRGSSPVTFNVSVSNQSGVPHTLTPKDGSVTVPANGSRDVELRLTVPAASAGDSSAFHDAGGVVNLTPVAGANAGVALHVPYYVVPRALSEEDVRAAGGPRLKPSSPSTTVTVLNRRGAAIAGNGDFYAWGIADGRDRGRLSSDVRAVGVQAFQDAGGPGDPLIVFGVSTFDRWSTASSDEFDLGVDVDPQNANGDDYVVTGVDFGAVTTGSFTGQYGAFVFSTRSPGASFLPPAFTFAPTDSSTLTLPILADMLCRPGEPCLSASNPRFSYHVTGIDIGSGSIDAVPQTAKFNAFSPSISTGAFLGPIAPGASAQTTVSIDPVEWAQTPALGELVLTTDNDAGSDEAQEVRLTLQG